MTDFSKGDGEYLGAGRFISREQDEENTRAYFSARRYEEFKKEEKRLMTPSQRAFREWYDSI